MSPTISKDIYGALKYQEVPKKENKLGAWLMSMYMLGEAKV